MRRQVRRDGFFKLTALLFLLAAAPLLADRLSAAAWGTLGFSLLAVLLGAGQIVWSGSWREPETAAPLADSLAADLALWRRRRPALVLLLGATPALAWQLYQLAYLALSARRSAPPGLVSLIFLVAGGPLIWLFSAWLHRARLDAWLLRIEAALETFDPERSRACAEARRRADRRTALLAGFFLLLLLAGLLIYRTGS